jgi:hypothetical protein
VAAATQEALRAQLTYQVTYRLRICLQQGDNGTNKDKDQDYEYHTELPFPPYPRLELSGKPFTVDGSSMNVYSATWDAGVQRFVCWIDDIALSNERRFDDECSWFEKQGWTKMVA